MWIKTFTVATVMVFLFGCRPSSAGPKAPLVYSRAEIFFVPWEVVTAVGLTPKVVREAARVRRTVSDDAELRKLLDVLDLPALRASDAGAEVRGDFRLVIELVRADGGAGETFAADRGRLVRLTDGASRPIDASFREYFASMK